MARDADEGESIFAAIRAVDWTAVACTISAAGTTAMALAAAMRPTWSSAFAEWQWAAVFGALMTLGVAAAIWKAALESRFFLGTDKKRDHISGWSFLALVCVMAAIVLLANWAASSSAVDRVIHAQWGIFVVVGVAGAFFLAALTPSEEFLQRVSETLNPITSPIRLLGRWLSGIDALLVFGVAGAAGALRTNPLLRYFLLFGTLIPCALLGYFLDAPWGLIPVGWGFLVAIAMSRAWAWVEDDRDVAMLSGKYSGDHLRMGFAQDLRDEALFSFMTMFFLVPLALRQFQLTADYMHLPLFVMSDDKTPNLWQWIAYYGTELAKAVPFVDWAEVYHVEGDANIAPQEQGWSRHLVFLTRVIVDLVLLAALLQALALSARNSRQRDLFKRGEIQILDPFTEPATFKKLRMRVNGDWKADPDKIEQFPKYNAQRLAELADTQRHPDIACVAVALRKRDGLDAIDKSDDFHFALLDRAKAKRKDPAAIDAAVSAIEIAKATLNVSKLAEVRRLLNGRPAMNGVRERIMRLIVAAPDTPFKEAALKEALAGSTRDTIGPVRAIALSGLERALASGMQWARDLTVTLLEDPAQRVRTLAAELSKRFGFRGA